MAISLTSPGAVRLHHLSAGLVAVVVGYTSSVALIVQAAASAGATPAQLGSWLGALGIGTGLTTLALSLRYRMPILTAWSTPGAALLITTLSGVNMSEAIGAFLLSSLLIMVCGFSGLFARILHRLPRSLAAAMLAGILLHFGLELFVSLHSEPELVGTMLLGYLLFKPLWPRHGIVLVMLLGMTLAWLQGTLSLEQWGPALLQPQWTRPSFSMHGLLGIAIPLFMVTMSSQNLPGIAVLKAHDYHPPVSPLIGWTGLVGVLLAPFGGFCFNLAAITAALCMGKPADPDPQQRYLAAGCAGLLYLLTGLLGATLASLFSLLPPALIMAMAGIALLGTLGGSLQQALHDEPNREAALITLLLTASGVSFWGIGSAFWGLLAGVLALLLRDDRVCRLRLRLQGRSGAG